MIAETGEEYRERIVIRMITECLRRGVKVGALPKWIPVHDIVDRLRDMPPLLLITLEDAALTDASWDDLAWP